MVGKICPPTWAIPTTYGAVVTQITDSRKLLRAYLNTDAAVEFSRDSPEVTEQLEARGFVLCDTSSLARMFHEDRESLLAHTASRDWPLFSLHPLQVSVQTVNYCNARCDFCYANAPGAGGRREIEPETVFKLKDYAAEHGVKFALSGGEPLLHPGILDMLAYRSDEVFDTLITNMTPDMDPEELASTGVDLVQVSLHGPGRTHDDIVGIRDAYRKIMGRMGRLLPDVNMATNTVITEGNIGRIRELLDDLRELQDRTGKRLEYVRFVAVVPSGAGIDVYKVEGEFTEKVRDLLRNLEADYPDMTFEAPLLHANPYEYFLDGGRWVCPAGSTVCVVRLDGRLVPCNQFLDTEVCSELSVHQAGFREIWLNDPVLSRIREGLPAAGSGVSCEDCKYLMMREGTPTL